jgi:rare lipoprotein A
MRVVLRALVIVLVMLVAACGAAQTKKGKGTGTGTGKGTGGEVQAGMATWYATGTMTASGERFDKNAMTAAHRTLPFGTVVRVTHRRSHKSVTVRINDRGPFGSKKRIIDVSKGAGAKLGIIDEGVAPVTVEVIKRAPPRKKKKR